MTEVRYLSADETRAVSCPQCGASVGRPCVGTQRGASNHASRVNVAAKAMGVKLPHRTYHSRRR